MTRAPGPGSLRGAGAIPGFTERKEQTMATSKYEQALVFAARHGNDKCFEALYRSFSDTVYALARMSLPTAEDAEQATETCFFEAWQRLEKLPEGEDFKLWLLRIALEACGGTEAALPEGAEAEPELLLPASCAADPACRQRIGQAIFSQSRACQQAAVLAWFDDLPTEEVAAVLGCSPREAELLLSETRRAVRTALGDAGNGAPGMTLGDFLHAHAPGLRFPKEAKERIRQCLLERILGGEVNEAEILRVEAEEQEDDYPVYPPEGDWRRYEPEKAEAPAVPPAEAAAEGRAPEKNARRGMPIWLLALAAGLCLLVGIVLIVTNLMSGRADTDEPLPTSTTSPAELFSSYVGEWVWEAPDGAGSVTLTISRMEDNVAYGSLEVPGLVSDGSWQAALDAYGGSFNSAGFPGAVSFGGEGITLSINGAQYKLTRSDNATIEIG